MTARTVVVAALDEALSSLAINVMPYARDIDPPNKPTVMVRVDEVRPQEPFRAYRFALVLVSSMTTPGSADDELDGLLEDVLYALDQSTQLSWEVATRATYSDSAYPAYEVALTVTMNKE